jgi:hypothetical protein
MSNARAQIVHSRSRIGPAYRLLLRSGLVAGLLWTCGASAQVSAPMPTAAVDPYSAFIAEASQRFGTPERWIRAVMRAESRGDPRATSPKGAMGLMQIMPATWAYLSARYGLGANPYDPRANILAGAAYLRELSDRYDSPGFLAAYNAGPGRYDDFRAKGRPLPAETVAYVAAIAPAIGAAPLAPSVPAVAPDPLAWTRSALFIPRADNHPGTPVAQAGDAPTAPPLQIADRSAGPLDAPRDTIFVARLGSQAPRK